MNPRDVTPEIARAVLIRACSEPAKCPLLIRSDEGFVTVSFPPVESGSEFYRNDASGYRSQAIDRLAVMICGMSEADRYKDVISGSATLDELKR